MASSSFGVASFGFDRKSSERHATQDGPHNFVASAETRRASARIFGPVLHALSFRDGLAEVALCVRTQSISAVQCAQMSAAVLAQGTVSRHRHAAGLLVDSLPDSKR